MIFIYVYNYIQDILEQMGENDDRFFQIIDADNNAPKKMGVKRKEKGIITNQNLYTNCSPIVLK